MTENFRVVLVRHGETAWSASGRHTGRTEVALTEEGIEQARRLPQLLAPLRLDDPLVIASPRARALDTARLAGLAVDAVDDRLAEWDYGDYEGVTTTEIRKAVPGWTVWTHPCPGGETAAQVAARADALLRSVAGPGAERDVVLVGHGHFSRALMARWIDADVTLGARVAMPTAAVAELGHEHEYRVVCSVAGPGRLPAPHEEPIR
ncbi:acid phosphatase [Tomitella fengzijianii]|uniref:Acid phosphatase n=1 Tax=Tomitella fengzijianii TaxID=2597660 RepID=A0A516X681_9ACTN|nr:acid phosphatase [Tomitella fengzijianii]QDQ98181.1 acid phosphatase [Tomitella fengzijianii]